MADKSFILMSLKEDKVKKMTQVLNNDTCRKILDYLSNHDKATATGISKDLGIAMSTVHYNLKQLVENDLVTSDEYHYSKRGKEIIHYGLANKYIIIAPKEDKSIMAKLKGFLPITLITAATGAVIYLIESYWTQILSLFNFTNGAQSANIAMQSETFMASRIIDSSVAVTPTTSMVVAPWFLFGAAFVILIMITRDLLKKK